MYQIATRSYDWWKERTGVTHLKANPPTVCTTLRSFFPTNTVYTNVRKRLNSKPFNMSKVCQRMISNLSYAHVASERTHASTKRPYPHPFSTPCEPEKRRWYIVGKIAYIFIGNIKTLMLIHLLLNLMIRLTTFLLMWEQGAERG